MAKKGQRPSFGDKVNGIVKYIEDPCDAPFLLYVELARKPALKAVLSFFSFGLSDIMRGYFRPKGLRSKRHGRGGRKSGVGKSRLGRALGRVPGIGDDIGNIIGKRIVGGEVLQQRHVSQGVKNLWIVDGLLQRALFYWLIIGITTDFLYEWSSLLARSEFCKRTWQAGLYAVGTVSGALAIQGWVGQLGMSEQRSYGGALWSGVGAALGPGQWTVVFAMKMEQSGNPGSSDHECRLVDAAGFTLIAESGIDTVELGEVSELVVTADVTGPISVLPQARVSWARGIGQTGDFWVGSNG